ncbi:RNA polymerase sigma factor [Nonomuraea sp. SYSU D8015]|uniref:RNA polymerase sigma factor n=1 Tax=Nonomuraea sp. SYSU D8015 TaxID=2593644 RepID=UPI0016617EB7|nr:sigma-70 family RNA polymerase sigma factor [Nonomuraea sp. SYSU D8015]
MNDRVLVEALRARDPGALAALYDAYAEEVYRYCRSLLLSADSAQVALRDTLIAAEAHAGALTEPDRLRTWLYALARVECVHRRAAEPPGAEEALAEAPPLDDPADADLRVMAWNAVHGLPVADREILELSIRHELPDAELAQVLGIPARQVESAMEEARDRLCDAITAEILARKGPYDCPRRAAILSGFSGELTAAMRERLVRHLPQCEICAPHRGRQVSATKVFELLPQAEPPDSLRLRVLSCFVDPELLPYRRYVARRTGALGAAGFPVTAEKGVRRWPQALAGTLAAVAAAVAIAMIFQQVGGGGGLSDVATAAFPATGEPAIRLPWQGEPEDVPLTVQPILDSTGTRPLPSSGSPEPRGLTGSSPPSSVPADLTQRPGTSSHPGSPPAEHPVQTPPGGHPVEPPPGRPHPTKPRPGPRTPCKTPTRTPTPPRTPTPTHTATPTTATPSSSPTQTSTPPATPSATVAPTPTLAPSATPTKSG